VRSSTSSATTGRRMAWILLPALTTALSLVGLAAPLPQQVFRSTVDLIAVDVQVIDNDGKPIAEIGPESFSVSINGRPRKVASAQFVRQATTETVGLTGRRLTASLAKQQQPTNDVEGRTFILAFDDGSFDPGSTRPAIEAAQHFVDSLDPNDRLGLYVYPTGPRMQPTTDRAAIRASLGRVVGQKWSMISRFNLRPSEIVDITAAIDMGVRARQNTLALDGTIPNAGLVTAASPITSLPPDFAAVLDVASRECPGQADCVSSILNEVAMLAPHLENQAASSLGGLDDLLRGLAGVPGRKAVVLVSAGILVSDRKDGRPGVGDLSKTLGQVAAQANVTVYTVQMEANGVAALASARLPTRTSNRDKLLFGNWLDEFSATAGGSRIYVPVGGGAFAFDRVLRETSAHYLLGVEPAEADRDGRPRQLSVKVSRPGVTVHGRQWVVVPPRPGV